MPQTHPVVSFLLVLICSLALSFFIHTALLQNMGLPKDGNRIVLSYLVNGILAAAIYMLLFAFRYKLKNQIGFLFIVGSFLKFICFFLLFYPAYKEDGEMDRMEFAAFFVPYCISLVIETIFMAKMLKKLD
jgi:F0F1-type ATP synthase assembly protein I